MIATSALVSTPLPARRQAAVAPSCLSKSDSSSKRPASRVTPRCPRFSRSRQISTTSSRLETLALQNPDLQAVIFDLDGVLCDSEHVCRKAASHMFSALHGVQVPEKEFIPFQGMGDKMYFESIAEKFGVTAFDLESAQRVFFEFYSKEIEKADIQIPGAKRLVDECMAAGLKIAVASSAARNKVFANLSAIGLAPELFDAVISGDMISRVKPHPDIFLMTSERIGVPVENCIVIEDSPAGVRAARSAGIACMGVTTTESASRLLEIGVDSVYSDISEIDVAALSGTYAASTSKPKDKVEGQPVQDWLQATINLPGNLKTDRRSILQVLNLGLASTCAYFIFSRSQALSVVSPKAFLSALNPFSRNPAISTNSSNRIDAFKRFIANVEETGGGREVRDFPSGVDWFNAPPLSLRRDLKGRLIILDFWTYCCINCMHIIPDLQYLERRFVNDPVTVVGVHSAKFDNEKDSSAIRNAVLRYDISHPVVNDRNMVMWKDLGVSSWPTLMVLSPKGRLLFTLLGEGHRQDLDDLITAGLQYYGTRQLLESGAVPESLEKLKDERLLGSGLRFPGKVASDIEGDRLFISDSNNDRIVITTLSGVFLDQIGGNGAKLVDGSYEKCCFNRPQGVCYDSNSDVLYVADTENHALREVNLKSKTVATLAGNGYQGRDYTGGLSGKQQQLSSPWDVELGPVGSNLFVAMAGQHQIWKYDLSSTTMAVFSGNGYERNKNGDNSKATSWAQPSGLSLLPGEKTQMVVADSESSSIRKLSLNTGGSQALAGGDPLFSENLFRFGDVDGRNQQVLLQHPLGVMGIGDDKVFVADSYNHKIKLCDLTTLSVKTVAGTGTAGFADGSSKKSMLSEPSGFAMGPSNTLFVADTNNSVIRVFDIETEELRTLDLKNVPSPNVSPLEDDSGNLDAFVPPKVVVVDEVNTQTGIIAADVRFPRGYGFTKGAVSSFTGRVVGKNSEVVKLNPERGVMSTDRNPNFRIQYETEASKLGGTKIQIDCKIYYCQEGKECLLEDVRFEIPFSANLQQDTSTIALSVSPTENS